MHKLHVLILCLLAVASLASCSSNDVDPSSTSNATDIDSYITTKALSGSYTSSGLYYILAKPSSSTVSPVLGDELELMYKLAVITRSSSNTAILIDKVVDSAYAKTSTFFPFFSGSLKPGLEEGLLKMHEGESTILLMPSKLAFKNVGDSNLGIAANAPVRYDVTLVRTRTETQQITEYIANNKLTVSQTTASGIRVIIRTANPTGELVSSALGANKTLTLKYVGKQLRAKTAVGFDSTGTNLNQYNVAGYAEGINLLHVGEKATLIFPSSVGYKSAGLVENNLYKVAPNTPLLYDVEVVSAK